jgi:HEAT repeat protein
MTGLRLLAAFLLLLTAVSAGAQGKDAEADRLYRAVLDGGFYSDKLAAGERLGRLGTPLARKHVMALVGDEDYWNREAGLKGLAQFSDPEAAETILFVWLDDHMTDDTAEEIMSGQKTRFQPLLESRYAAADSDTRSRILALFGRWGTPATDRFLSARMADRKDPLRGEAFTAYLETFPERKRDAVIPLVNDPDLRPAAMGWVADYGNKGDLPLLREILSKKEKALYGEACRGINRLAELPETEAVLFEMLSSGDPEAVYPALYALDRPVSERIMKKLCAQVFDGPFQEIRMLAALRLTAYRDKRIVPALIRARKESFSPDQADGWDIFAAHVTLGLSALFRHIGEKQREKDFDSNQETINRHLQLVTGEKWYTPEDWTRWALANGFTVGGQSLITTLFSPDETAREKAFDDAIRLMGQNPRDFYKKNPALLELSPADLALELAKRLSDGKYIMPEKP